VASLDHGSIERRLMMQLEKGNSGNLMKLMARRMRRSDQISFNGESKSITG
jgi:hypothetical protein